MIKVKNSTGEVISVLNVIVENGQIIAEPRRPRKTSRFFEKFPMMLRNGVSADGRDTFTLAEGFELVTGRAPRKPKVSKPAQVEPVEPTVEPANQWANASDPIVQGYVIDAQAGMSIEAIERELCDKYGAMGADIFKAVVDVCGIQEPKVASNTQTVNVVTPSGTHKVVGKVNKDYEIFCNLVQAGKPLYMYGPAGSGKSYTAKQIADGLGMAYYETSQAMFAHELKGYGDAKGDFVETAFYRAFRFGGVFFLDEVDASAPEALVVLNNAIANKRFDFPVIGNVDAHPDFRVIAAGNTRMTGATIEYTARQLQDTSFKNRFFFAAVTYDRDVMLDITGGDEEIVNFGADLRKAARETGISQLFSYRQAKDLAELHAACKADDVFLLRGSVLQEKEVDDTINLYEHLTDKENKWAKVMKKAINQMKNEEIW